MFLTYSLASQPLLTLKAREVLVNEHTAVCPRSDIKTTNESEAPRRVTYYCTHNA